MNAIPEQKLIWLATGAEPDRQALMTLVKPNAAGFVMASIKRVGIQRDNGGQNTADSTASASVSSFLIVLVLMH